MQDVEGGGMERGSRRSIPPFAVFILQLPSELVIEGKYSNTRNG
jgi:hypothetical protein